MTERFSDMPEPPYYVVVFANQLSENHAGYHQMLGELEELAKTIPGYIGRETARDQTGFGLALSYWESEEAIKAWKAHADHFYAQTQGKDRWYSHYVLRVAKVERHYDGPEGR